MSAQTTRPAGGWPTVIQGKSLEQWIATAREQRAAINYRGVEESFAVIAGFGEPAIDTLLSLYEDQHLRDYAGLALVKMGAVASPKLVSAINEQNKERLVPTLLSYGPDAGPAVIAGLGSADPLIRGQCARILMLPQCKIERKPAVPALIKLTKDKDGFVRHMAVIALGRTGSVEPDVHAVLQDVITNDAESQIKGAAVQSLASAAAVPGQPAAGNPQVTILAAQLAHEDPHVRIAAVEALMKLGPAAEPAIDGLKRIAETPERAGFHSNIRHNAVLALGRIGWPAVPALGALVRNRDMRLSAIETLNSLGQNASAALPDIIAWLQTDEIFELSDHGRSCVFGTLRSMGPAAAPAMPVLRKLRDHPKTASGAREVISSIALTPPLVELVEWKPLKPQLAVTPIKADPSAIKQVQTLLKLMAPQPIQPGAPIGDQQRRHYARFAATVLARIGQVDEAAAVLAPFASDNSTDRLLHEPTTRAQHLGYAALFASLTGDADGANRLSDEALALAVGMQQWGGWRPPGVFKDLALLRLRAGDLAGAAKVVRGLQIIEPKGYHPNAAPQAPGRAELLDVIVQELVLCGATDEAVNAALSIDGFEWRARGTIRAGVALLALDRQAEALKMFDEALGAIRYLSGSQYEQNAAMAGRLRCDPNVETLIGLLSGPSADRQSKLQIMLWYLTEKKHQAGIEATVKAMLPDESTFEMHPSSISGLCDLAGQFTDPDVRDIVLDAIVRLCTRPTTFDAGVNPHQMKAACHGMIDGMSRVAGMRAANGQTAEANRLLDKAQQIIETQLPQSALPTLKTELQDKLATSRASVDAVSKQWKAPLPGAGRPQMQQNFAAQRVTELIYRNDFQAAVDLILASRDALAQRRALLGQVLRAASLKGDDKVVDNALAGLAGVDRVAATLDAAETLIYARPARAGQLVNEATVTMRSLDASTFPSPAAQDALEARMALAEAYLDRDREALARLSGVTARVLAAARAGNGAPRLAMPALTLTRAQGRCGQTDLALQWVQQLPEAQRQPAREALLEGVLDRAAPAMFKFPAERQP